jgi:hypothetical protein
MIAIVKYRVATYEGEIQVNCNENDENDSIIARAKARVTRESGGYLPFGSESWKVIDRVEEEQNFEHHCNSEDSGYCSDCGRDNRSLEQKFGPCELGTCNGCNCK